MDIFNSGAKKEAERIYSTIDTRINSINYSFKRVQNDFGEKAQKLGKVKLEFQSKEVGALVNLLSDIYKQLKSDVKYKKIILSNLNIHIDHNVIKKLEEYSLSASDTLDQVASMGVSSASAILAGAGVMGSAGFFTSGILTTATTALLGTTAHISGTLATIGGGSYIAGALGFGGTSVAVGGAIVGGAVLAPLAIGGIIYKRMKNQKILEEARIKKAQYDVQFTSAEAKIRTLENTVKSLDLTVKTIEKLRQSASLVYSNLHDTWNECSNRLNENSAKERLLTSITLSYSFLTHSKKLLEFEIISKAKEDLPKINPLFDNELTQMFRSFDPVSLT